MNWEDYQATIWAVGEEFIEEEYPEEADLFGTVSSATLSYLQQRPSEVTRSFDDQRFGFGIGDLGEALKSPAVLFLLATFWTGLLLPMIKELAVEVFKHSYDRSDVERELKRKLYRRETKEYIVAAATRLELSRPKSEKLADHVLTWLDNHPDHLEQLLHDSRQT